MTDWYYESDGNRAGPVSEDRIKELIVAGTLSSRSLVWSNDFETSWKPIGETPFASISGKIGEPPPLPARVAPGPEANRSEEQTFHQQGTQTDAQAFLVSDLTRQLIGKNADHYLSKWNSFLQSGASDLSAVVKQRSWNWSAFFVPYGWLIYRKMYGLAAIVVACILFSQFFGSLAYVVAFGAGIIVALYANAWYFGSVHQKWLKIRTVKDAELVRRATSDQGGTNLPWAVGVGVGLVVLGGFLSTEGSLFSSGLSCSSAATQELVANIAREQIPKDSYMMFVVDEKNTKISLKAIRTQATENASVRCAASIVYTLAFKGQGAEPARAPLEQVLNRDITYKVEKTDRGDQLYATVYGLNN